MVFKSSLYIQIRFSYSIQSNNFSSALFSNIILKIPSTIIPTGYKNTN